MKPEPPPTPAGPPVRPIRVLVADDQSFMRIALRQILDAHPDIQVVGEARNGREAVEMARTLRPDAITLDVEMPEMGGLDACAEIVRTMVPPPTIIMVSAYTQRGADAAIRALHLGAVDFVSKSSVHSKMDLARVDSELPPKLRAWTRRPAAAAPQPSAPAPAIERPGGDWLPDMVVIAVSTGGPQALTRLFSRLDAPCMPIVVAQHMPRLFTESLAHMLSHDAGVDVREGSHRMALPAGTVTLIPGARDGMIASRRGGGYELRLVDLASTVHPSGDALFESATLVCKAPVGIVLTGMGEDGAAGAAALRRRGMPVLVQDPGSCVVDGMPAAALRLAPGCESLSLERIADRLDAWSRRIQRTGPPAAP